jgi:membrane-associated phospholipid phosphatase
MGLILTAADRLSLSFIALLGLATLCSLPSLASGTELLTTYLLLAVVLSLIAGVRNRSGSGNAAFYLHVAFTVAMVLMLFNSLGQLIPHVRSATYDEQLIGIDHALFGVHPTVWMERLINPVLTAVLQFAYISYYFIPVALGVTLIARGRRAEFEEALFGIVLCFYLSYIGYLLVPAVGPRFTLQHLQTAGLQAGPFITALQETLNSLEHNKMDAFPSGHTAVALVSLFYARKTREKLLFRILVPIVLLLLLSTVYLRYHYVIDVVAGIALALVTAVLAPPLERLLSGAARHERDQRHGPA